MTRKLVLYYKINQKHKLVMCVCVYLPFEAVYTCTYTSILVELPKIRKQC